MSSYPTSVNGIIVLLNTIHYIKLSQILLSTDSSLIGHFEGKVSVIKLPVSIFGQTIEYSIFIVSRKPIRLPEIQYPVFGI